MPPYKITGRPPTIFRAVHDKTHPFVVTDSRIPADPTISWKAKGILSYCLSRPDGWEINVPDLVNHAIDGPAAVRTGLKELRQAGYLLYNPKREQGRIVKWIIEVHEEPIPKKGGIQPDSDNRNVVEAEAALDADFQQVEKQLVVNRGQLRIKNLNSTGLEVVEGEQNETYLFSKILEAAASQGVTPFRMESLETSLNGAHITRADGIITATVGPEWAVLQDWFARLIERGLTGCPDLAGCKIQFEEREHV